MLLQLGKDEFGVDLVGGIGGNAAGSSVHLAGDGALAAGAGRQTGELRGEFYVLPVPVQGDGDGDDRDQRKTDDPCQSRPYAAVFFRFRFLFIHHSNLSGGHPSVPL